MSSSADMKRQFKLPLLPGSSFGEEMLRKNFRKSQILTSGDSAAIKGIPKDFDSAPVVQSPTALGGTSRTLASTLGSTAPLSATGGSTAGGASVERAVLRFFGYCIEAVTESALERSRVRKVTLCYFLEDNTISVSEPKEENTGMAFGGTMLKRHQVPSSVGAGTVTYDQLSVGASVTFYGREYYLTDCDAFTREYMASLGMPQQEALPLPEDPYAASRKPFVKPAGIGSVAASVNAAGMKVKLSPGEVRATKQFLVNDRKVLRFDTVWNDEKALYGETHKFTLYYFLADDSIEVVEKSDPAGGRDPFPSFVRRQRMQKPRPGTTKFENTVSALTFAKRTDATVYYSDADLAIGATVVVFGRPLLIYDCDKFTQDHLREKFGLTDFTPIEVSKPAPAPPKREPPPYNGYGDEEDSLGSWRSLDIKPPRRDQSKAVKYGDGVVKFALKIEGDDVRSFVLTCYLADSTISIFEPVTRNAGIVGGKFLQRQKVVNPETGKPFVAADFYVGAKQTINGFRFVAQATDERSLALMESHSTDFSRSNINTIVHKLQAMLVSSHSRLAAAFAEADADRSGTLDAKELSAVFERLELPLCEQEVLTLLRYFDRNGDACVSFSELTEKLLSDATPGSDPRPWDVIYREATSAEYEALSLGDKVAKQHDRVQTVTAAYAARAFLEAYAARRHLFHTEFKFITDYSTDNLIGEKEFRVCVVDKLRLSLTEAQISALSAKLFPPTARRVTFEEFVRLMTNTSVHDHNLEQIKRRR